MYEYQKNQKYFAQVTGSLEKYAAIELEILGTKVLSESHRGLRFSCDKETLYKVVYCSRLIQRVLAPLLSMQCHSEKYLYQQAFHNIDWTNLFSLEQCFSIITNVNNSNIQNSLYAGQILKDAICDKFKQKYGKRPNFKPKDGDVVINLYINDNWATISYDVFGISLHKRGYRKESTAAPLQETIAAAIVQIINTQNNLKKLSLSSAPTNSNRRSVTPIFDIMCGSGTILAEALMAHCDIPAGYLRNDNTIKYMPDYDDKLWEKVKKNENNKIKPLDKHILFGSDISKECIEITKTNLKNLPYYENIVLETSPFQNLSLIKNRIIVCNPPYGIRMGNTNDIKKLYNDLGDFLKQKCTSSIAYILCGKPDLLPELRLRIHSKKTLKNGDIDTKLAKVIIR